MTLEEFQEKALKQFTKEITDVFFCYIENDRELMHDYIRVIGRDDRLDNTNMNLGMTVKEWFKLENGEVNLQPKSKLIESYTEHFKRP
jgi:hypothetical protein